MSNGAKIGKYLKYQRKKNDLTLYEMSKSSGLSSAFLLKLERGDYKDVKFDVMQKISKSLGTDIISFLYKCKIISTHKKLPALRYYLKEKYQFPKNAINETREFIKYMKFVHKKSIELQIIKHKKYWLKNK